MNIKKYIDIFLIFMLFGINIVAINYEMTSNRNVPTEANQIKPIDSFNHNTEFQNPIPSTINVITSPNSLSSWDIGDCYYIHWNFTEGISKINISLYVYGDFYSTIANNINNTGSFYWYLPLTISPNNSSRIAIVDSNNSKILCFSDNFIINPKNSITLSNPMITLASTWESVSIDWTSKDPISFVNVFLLFGDKYNCTLANDTTNNEGYTWAIPIPTPANLSAGPFGPFEFKVEDSLHTNTSAISDNFDISFFPNPGDTKGYEKDITIGADIVVGIVALAFISLIALGFLHKRSKNV